MIKYGTFRIFSALVVFMLCLSGRGLSRARMQPFEETVTATPGEEISLDLQSGGAIQIHGWDQNSVRVRIDPFDDGKKAKITLEKTSGGVLVRAQPTSGENIPVNYHFEVWVPRKYNLSINSAGGELLISDVEGNFRGKTRGGRIFISHSRGHTELSTGGGEVRLTDCDLSGSVTTAKGITQVSNVHGGVQVSSSSQAF
jgi:hypothetical protein